MRVVGPRQVVLWPFMMFDGRWKYIHLEGFRAMLFDTENDPEELCDLGDVTCFPGLPPITRG